MGRIDPVDFKGFSAAMSEREDEHFDIDDEFLGEAEESQDFDAVLERGKAAWSRVEDVLAERQLEKELRDIFEDE